MEEIEQLERALISYGRLPLHIAIIMDGNRRWAEQHQLSPEEGHKAGVRAVKKIVRYCGRLGIKVLTLYTFSKENWKRPAKEVSALMRLLKITSENELGELMENNVKLIATGEIQELPLPSRKALLYAISKTKENTGLILNLAINYSGKEEIIRATRLIAKDYKAGKIDLVRLDEKTFENYLYHPELPPPDLIIRTSGENRLSNFLLWQSSYAEFYVTKTLWPDFDERELLIALIDYSRRERRFGGRNAS
ncbi:MAG: isoprenyl transferase [bacterium]